MLDCQSILASDEIAVLRGLELFRDLPEASLGVVASQLRLREAARGEVLVTEGDEAESFYIVLSGRFEARVVERDQAVAEIGVGEPIGEIAFFAGGRRTATVTALRPSAVVEIDCAAFERIKFIAPGIERNLIAQLARRLDTTTRNLLHMPCLARASVVAVISSGRCALPPSVLERIRAAFANNQTGGILCCANGEERRGAGELSVLIANAQLDGWTRASLRQADELVIIVEGEGPQPINEVEAHAFELIPPVRRRLARLHAQRGAVVTGTRKWLQGRDVGMIHHLSCEDDSDFARLARFLSGHAIGFVAGGGGAFGTAHIGVFKALQERGVSFDIYGGASVGSAMAAAFAMLRRPQEVIDGVRDIFIERRALRKMTIPRYSLLDHRPFDDALKRRYGDAEIEDVWKPFFAVATDLSLNRLRLLRSGPVWKAVRASSSIPGVLPPVFGEDGAMLVDGGIADNVPLEPMAGLKRGPNVVVSLDMPQGQFFDVDYDRIPGRMQLALRFLNPLRRRLPPCPGPISVIHKSVFANARQGSPAAGPHDLILSPPPWPGTSVMDWSHYEEVFEASYRWTRNELRRLEEA
ncbi:MAG: patatin-like phospholipase family protein, partial [Roseiarcus sp.]